MPRFGILLKILMTMLLFMATLRRFCENYLQRRRFTQILQSNMKATRQGAKGKFGLILGI